MKLQWRNPEWMALIALGLLVGTAHAQDAASAKPVQPAQNEGAPQGQKQDPNVFVIGGASAPHAASGGEFVPSHVALSDAKLDERDRLDLIRIMSAEFAFTKRALPIDPKGIVLHANGGLDPSDEAISQMMIKNGVSAKKGDRIQITGMQFEGRAIKFEINGGLVHKRKWYQNVQVGVGGASSAPLDKPDDPRAHGTFLRLEFPRYIPNLTGDQVRALLAPLLDFSVKSPLVAYADTLPPKTRAAVLDHRVLVGMNREMVMASVGRPDQKFRQPENGIEYEDWMYGKPPAEVKFLRFKGDDLVRVEEVSIGSAPVFRTAREVDETEVAQIEQQKETAEEQAKARKEEAARPKPTLRRTGEADPNAPTDGVPTGGTTQSTGDTASQQPSTSTPGPHSKPTPIPGTDEQWPR